MKKHFTKYLLEDLGFKPFRRINSTYVENNINDFSTLQDGGLDIRYVKGYIVIVWGLHEFKKPPTLIYPRPKILFNGMNERYDDAMNVCLKKESNEDIFKALFDKNILFNYSD